MRNVVVTLSALLLASLTACSPADHSSSLDDALGHFGGQADAPRFAVMFADVESIRASVGYEGTLNEPDPNPDNRVAAWGNAVPRLAFPAQLAGFTDAPLVDDWDPLKWTAVSSGTGSMSTIVNGITEVAPVPDPDSYPWNQLTVKSDEESTFIVGKDTTVRRDAPNSLTEHERLKALRPCLADAQLVAILAPEGEPAHAVAAKVHNDANGTVWSCIHAPGKAEAVAKALKPNRTEYVSVGEQSIDGDVIRTELITKDDGSGVPVEASIVLQAPEAQLPLF